MSVSSITGVAENVSGYATTHVSGSDRITSSTQRRYDVRFRRNDRVYDYELATKCVPGDEVGVVFFNNKYAGDVNITTGQWTWFGWTPPNWWPAFAFVAFLAGLVAFVVPAIVFVIWHMSWKASRKNQILKELKRLAGRR